MVKQYFIYIRTQLNAKVKIVRSDNAKELCEFLPIYALNLMQKLKLYVVIMPRSYVKSIC